jgi:hypothetical protein
MSFFKKGAERIITHPVRSLLESELSIRLGDCIHLPRQFLKRFYTLENEVVMMDVHLMVSK